MVVSVLSQLKPAELYIHSCGNENEMNRALGHLCELGQDNLLRMVR